jgi:hypothetical protein
MSLFSFWVILIYSYTFRHFGCSPIRVMIINVKQHDRVTVGLRLRQPTPRLAQYRLSPTLGRWRSVSKSCPFSRLRRLCRTLDITKLNSTMHVNSGLILRLIHCFITSYFNSTYTYLISIRRDHVSHVSENQSPFQSKYYLRSPSVTIILTYPCMSLCPSRCSDRSPSSF